MDKLLSTWHLLFSLAKTFTFEQDFLSGHLKKLQSDFTWNDWTKLNTLSDSFRLEWSSSWRLKQQQIFSQASTPVKAPVTVFM